MSSYLENLPTETFSHICEYLDYWEKYKLREVCQRFKLFLDHLELGYRIDIILQEPNINKGKKINSIAISSDRKIIAFASNYIVTIVDLFNKKIKNLDFSNDKKVANAKKIKSIFFSYEDTSIITLFSNSSIKIDNKKELKQKIIFWNIKELFKNGQLTREREYLISGDYYFIDKIYNFGRYLFLISIVNRKFDILRYEENILTAGNHTILKHYFHHAKKVNEVVLFSDGSKILSASSDKTLKIWNFENRKSIGVLKGHKSCVTNISLFSAERKAISGSRDGTLKIWNLEKQICLMTLNHGHIIKNVLVLQNRRKAISLDCYGILKIWDIKTGRCHYILNRKREKIDKLYQIESDSEYEKIFTTELSEGKLLSWELGIKK